MKITQPSSGSSSALGLSGVIDKPIVANNMDFTGFSGTGNNSGQQGGTYQQVFTVVEDATDLVLPYGNFANKANGLNNIFVRAAVEYPYGSGNYFPLFFYGKRDVTIEPAAFVKNTPLAIKVTAGTQIGVQTLVTVTNVGTDKWPNNYTNAKGTAGTTDNTMTSISTFAGTAYGPVAMMGTTKSGKGGLLLIGDSILLGYKDAQISNPMTLNSYAGFALRAINNQAAYTRLCYVGEKLTEFMGYTFSGSTPVQGTVGYARRSLINGHRKFLLEYGNNDIHTGTTLVQMQAQYTTAVNDLVLRGMRGYGCTITPRTSSTDSFATLDGQTPLNQTYAAVIDQFNTWLLNNYASIGLDGVFDVASAVTARNIRNELVWVPGTVDADGIHPNATGTTAQAAAVDANRLVS